MDVSLESALSTPGAATDQPGQLAGRPLEEWNAAYAKVESYFHALRVRNKMLQGQLVLQVLKCAMQRAPNEPQHSATELAADETDRVVTDWFAQVLQEGGTASTQSARPALGDERPPAAAAALLSTRGRLALLLADMPGKWQDQFLRPGPWPAEFIAAMRDNYLRAGPDFQLSQMTPRPLDLGPIATLTSFSRLPYAKMVAIWAAFALVLVVIFILTH